MHIPENYISPSTCAVAAVAMAPVVAYSIKQVTKKIDKKKMPLLGVFAAFSFIAMMFNVPLPGGTTGHAVGGTLIAILLGPEAACLSMSIALILQAILFGDGGILSIGANCFNMAFVLPFLGYAIYSLISNKIKSKKGRYIGAAIGSYVGINAAALLTSIELGIQPMLFSNADGTALYCPYDLSVSIPAIMLWHLTIVGVVEMVFTLAVMSYVDNLNPSIIGKESKTKKQISVGVLLAILVILTPIGLIASGTAWGEWGTDELIDMIGYVPTQIESGTLSSFEAMIPDYAIGGIPEVVGYILSAIIGVSILVIIFKVASAFAKVKVDYDNK